jgi:hypothetical protein
MSTEQQLTSRTKIGSWALGTEQQTPSCSGEKNLAGYSSRGMPNMSLANYLATLLEPALVEARMRSRLRSSLCIAFSVSIGVKCKPAMNAAGNNHCTEHAVDATKTSREASFPPEARKGRLRLARSHVFSAVAVVSFTDRVPVLLHLSPAT